MSDIKVSVCVVTYNHQKYIAKCLQSLVEQETDFPFEVIVNDDCSTDNTRNIVDDFAEKYPGLIIKNYQCENVGTFKNAISGYSLARGDYICHVDGDDYALPGKLQAQSLCLDSNNECVIVWSRSKVLDSENTIIVDDLLGGVNLHKLKLTRGDLILLGSVACHSSKMFRKRTLKNFSHPGEPFLDFFMDVTQIGSGYGIILSDFYTVYRAGIGTTSRSQITNNIFLSNLERICVLYPEFRAQASAQFFKIFLKDAKKFELNLKVFKLFAQNFKFTTPAMFYKSLRYISIFRSPVKR